MSKFYDLLLVADMLSSAIAPKNELYADGATINDVIFNAPATIVKWSDGSKTIVKCQEGDSYNPELGLAMCIAKKCCGNKGNFNNVFKKWLSKEG